MELLNHYQADRKKQGAVKIKQFEFQAEERKGQPEDRKAPPEDKRVSGEVSLVQSGNIQDTNKENQAQTNEAAHRFYAHNANFYKRKGDRGEKSERPPAQDKTPQEKCNNIQLEIDLDIMTPAPKPFNTKAESRHNIKSNKELEKYQNKKNFKINTNLEKEFSGQDGKQKQVNQKQFKMNLLPTVKKTRQNNSQGKNIEKKRTSSLNKQRSQQIGINDKQGQKQRMERVETSIDKDTMGNIEVFHKINQIFENKQSILRKFDEQLQGNLDQINETEKQFESTQQQSNFRQGMRKQKRTKQKLAYLPQRLDTTADHDEQQYGHKQLLTNNDQDRSVDLVDISNFGVNINDNKDGHNDVNNSFNQNIEINNDIQIFHNGSVPRQESDKETGDKRVEKEEQVDKRVEKEEQVDKRVEKEEQVDKRVERERERERDVEIDRERRWSSRRIKIDGYEEEPEIWERFLLNTGKQFSYRQSSLDKEYNKVRDYQNNNHQCLQHYLEIQQSLQHINNQLSSI